MKRHRAHSPVWPTALLAALASFLVWGMPAVADGGVIEGRLHTGTAGAALPAELVVTLEKLVPDGALTVAQQAKANPDGAFRFASIDTTSGYTYIVSAQYQNVTYRSTVSALEAGGATTPVELTIYETTDSDAAISVDIAHAVLQPDQESQGTWAIEVLVINNTGDRTFVGDPQVTIGGKQPTLRFSLPPGAHDPLPMQGLDRDEILNIVNGFADTSPVLPGQRSIAYSYLVPSDGEAMTYSRAMDYPTKRFAVLMADTGGRVEAVRLTQGEPAELGGQRYRTFIAEGLPVGDSVILRLSGVVASTASSASLAWIVAGVAALALMAGIVVHVRKRKPMDRALTVEAADTTQETLITAIADLDDAFEAGKIDEDEYRAERSAQKKRLARLMHARAEA